MVQIIIINGSGGVGKSTFISFCSEIASLERQDLSVIELSSVDLVKEVAKQCGWDGAKTEKDRAFLHDLKMLMENYNNAPNDYVFKQINYAKRQQPNRNYLFFVNIREADSIIKFSEQCYSKFRFLPETVLVTNAKVSPITSNEADKNVNNCGEYNYRIENNGDLEQLKETARNFLNLVVPQ